MRFRRSLVISTLVMFLDPWLGGVALAQNSFTALGNPTSNDVCRPSIQGISGDGTTIVGRCSSISGQSFRWTEGTGLTEVLIASTSRQVDAPNGDGSVITGFSTGTPFGPFRLNFNSGSFEFLPPPASDHWGNFPLGLSSDGDIVVGTHLATFDPADSRAFRYRVSSDDFLLLPPHPSCIRSHAYSVAADGNVVVGEGRDCPHHGFAESTDNFIWTPTTGTVNAGYLPGSSHDVSGFFAVSADGLFAVGFSGAGFSGEPIRYEIATSTMISLTPSGPLGGIAFDVANGGCTVVGGNGGTGFIWDPILGYRNLQDWLANDLGLDMTGLTIDDARGISDDGTVITGLVRNANVAPARHEPYRLVIENPACAVETAPIADAGTDQVVDEGEDLVSLDGTGSSDPQDDPLSYAWLQVAGIAVALNDASAAQPTFAAPFVVSNTTLTFELVVSDGAEFSEADSVDIAIVNVNNPPTADAGDDSTIKEGAVATLDGSNSFDPEGDNPLDYSWTQVAGSNVALLPNGTAVSPSFTAPLGVGTVLTFELAVGDGKETGAADSVNVTVVENSSPTANAGADQTVDEGSVVGLDGSNSSDPDGGDTLSFQWTQVGGAAVVLEDDTSEAPTFDAPSVPPGGEVLVFELVVTDDDPVNPQSSMADSVTVSVLNVNDPPICDLGRSTCPSSKLDKGDGCLLWPPNHKMVSVGISGVTDPNNDGVAIEITGVTQDEPVNGQGDGDSSPDAVIQPGDPADSVLLRSERTGLGGAQENGRVYAVSFTADDGVDTCSGSVSVGVPHDRKDTPIDDGQLFDSTLP